MPIHMRIGELARDRGWTIKALAEHAGVAYNTAHALATGRALRIDLDTLDRICAALQVEPGDVFVRLGAPTPREFAYSDGGNDGSDRDRAARTSD